MNNETVIPAALLRVVFESEHIPALFDGAATHEPALRFVAQLARFTTDEGRIGELVAATLPEGYVGDSLDEIPEMIRGALRKGYDQPPQGGAEAGYVMSADGLYFLKAKGNDVEKLFISAQFETVGLVRDTESQGWAHLLRWRDYDGRKHEFIASHRALLNDHELVCGDMSDRGLRIAKAQQVKLAAYILGSSSEARITLVTKTGWHEIRGKPVFVLPGEIIGEADEPVVYDGVDQKQPEFTGKGSLAEWKRLISVPGGEHALAVLAISAAFAGPLLHPAGQEGGGVHLFGNSSTGKTTMLKLAASVWGDSGVVRSWRATANGLEGAANRTNDIAMILDEIGQVDAKDAAASMYMLASGVGKVRMNRNATLQDIKTWRAFILSSGEMTVETKITQLRGATSYTGAALRLLNVGADRGLGYGALDGPGTTGNSADLVRGFAEAVRQAHGVAGPEFVRTVISENACAEKLREAVNLFASTHVKSGSHGPIERPAKRFVLLTAACWLSTQLGNTGCPPGVATGAAAQAFAKWKIARGGDGKDPAEDRKAIMHVTAFIVTYGESRFDELDRNGYPITSGEAEGATTTPRPVFVRYGWRKHYGDDRIWMIDDSKWESEVCKGFDPDQVSRALARNGFLKTAKGRFTYAERFEGKRNKRFHVITAKILTSDYDHTDADLPDDDDGIGDAPRY